MLSIPKYTQARLFLIAITLTAGLAFGKQELGDSSKWEKNIAQFEKVDAANPPPKNGIEFIGSSTIVK